MSYHTIDKQANNVYVNVVINSQLSTAGLTRAVYSINNTLEILHKPSDWYMSIIRFVVPLNLVPLYIIPIIPNQSNPNLTPIIIGISYNGIDYPQPVIYVSDDTVLTAPVQNKPTQVITPYYFVYTFQNLIDAYNTALLAAYNAAV